ncbi:MAG TPA: YkgJ family cysteine cluster protein [Nitrospirota bacterium]|nr:YkgJ family cysteine cluster protein [Nitrospirota bacterium]
MGKRDGTRKSGLSRRLSYPGDEKLRPWLSLLLDAYAIADTGIAVAIRTEEKKQGEKLACAKGCGNCCAHQKDLPLYPHELVGIYWFASEKMDPGVRSVLRDRLLRHAAGGECPFLIQEACSIHPMRPLGCRQFNVFTRPCSPGEDPYHTRRQDVLVPLPEYTDRVFVAVLPLYNMKTSGDRAGQVKIVRSQLMNLQAYDWKKLVEAMDKADAARSERG